MLSRLVQAPRTSPVHLTAVKRHVYVDHTNDDIYLADLLRVAVQVVEERTRVRLVAQQRRILLSSFPAGDKLTLPDPPLLSVESVVYTDSARASQTWAAANYVADLDGDQDDAGHGHVRLAYGISWPSAGGEINDVAVTYTCGLVIPVTADPTANTFTPDIAAPFDDDTPVRFINSGGAVPAGLTADTTYYVRDSGATTFKVTATAGGVAIDITDAGTGTTFLMRADADRGRYENLCHIVRLLVGHWYANREAVVIGQTPSVVPEAVDRLVGLSRTF